MAKLAKQVWDALSHAGTAVWLWTAGAGVIVTVLWRALTDLSIPWVILLGIGITCLAMAAVLTWPRLRFWERRTREQDKDRWIIENLARNLTIGRMYLSSIEYAGDEFEEALEELKTEHNKHSLPKDVLEARLDELLREDRITEVQDWKQRVGELLNKHFDYAYRARFESDAGLIPASPPEGISDFFRDRWLDHEMRLQRLYQIIEELSTNKTRTG